MKKIMFVSLFALLLVFSSSAYSAEKGWYMSGSFGVSLNDDADGGASIALPAGTTYSISMEYDPGYFVKFAPGYNFGTIRLEGELSYRTDDMDQLNETLITGEGTTRVSSQLSGSDTTTELFLINAYYDFLEGKTVQPYITGGIGVARTKMHILALHDQDSLFAYQVGAGLSYNVIENVVVDFGYRYFSTKDIEFDITDLSEAGIPVKVSNSGHLFQIGARYNF